VNRAKKKLDESFEELKELNIFESFQSVYNNYNDYLDTLTPDKIVCLFNMIVAGLSISSFFTVLSIMLSENVINRIKFLDRYPIILKILRIRNNINKKVAKFYLAMHLFILILGLLCNTYMLFF